MPIPRSAPRQRFRRWAALLALSAVVAVPLGDAVAAPRSPAPSAPAAQDGGWCADEEEAAFVDLVNEYRARNGLGPLTLSPTLGAAADAHSAEMAANNYFGHTMLGGVSVGENLANFGYPDSTIGENIAAGSAGAAGTLGQWQGSAVHNANLLGGAFEAVGIGRAYDPNSGYGWYWTAIFGGTADGRARPCGARPSTVESTPTPPPAVGPAPSLPARSSGSAAAAPAPAPEPAPGTASGLRAAAELNLRAGPGPGYDALGTVSTGSAIEVAGEAASGYLPVTVDGRFGWVAADFVASDAGTVPVPTDAGQTTDPAAFSPPPVPTPDAAPTSAPSTTGAAGVARTTADLLLRAAPGADAPVLLTIPAGAAVPLSGEASAGFLGVTYDGLSGWADAAYLTFS
jgi:uncharacterized protein YkwD/uncharacterized protein YraI